MRNVPCIQNGSQQLPTDFYPIDLKTLFMTNSTDTFQATIF